VLKILITKKNNCIYLLDRQKSCFRFDSRQIGEGVCVYATVFTFRKRREECLRVNRITMTWFLFFFSSANTPIFTRVPCAFRIAKRCFTVQVCRRFFYFHMYRLFWLYTHRLRREYNSVRKNSFTFPLQNTRREIVYNNNNPSITSICNLFIQTFFFCFFFVSPAAVFAMRFTKHTCRNASVYITPCFIILLLHLWKRVNHYYNIIAHGVPVHCTRA